MAKRYTLSWPSPGLVTVIMPPKEALNAEELDEILRSEFPGTPRRDVQIVPDVANTRVLNLLRK